MYGNTADQYWGLSPGSGDVQADPLIPYMDSGDWHIAGNSPCKDAGDDSVVLPTDRDIDREARRNGPIDIGADEMTECWLLGHSVRREYMMRRSHAVFVGVVLTIMLVPATVLGWDVWYTGDVTPTDPSLGDYGWTAWTMDHSLYTAQGGILSIVDDSTTAHVLFGRETWDIPPAVPLTVEARVSVASATAKNAVRLAATTMGFSTFVSLYPDRLVASFSSRADAHEAVYLADLAAFRTVRIATDSSGHSCVWVDGVLAAEGWTSEGYQGGIMFGAGSTTGTSESYWDYVAYSKEYLPVPEPSSLIALAGGLAGLGGMALRRRRR